MEAEQKRPAVAGPGAIDIAQSRQYSPRRGRGKAQKTIEMVAAMERILKEIQPATVRAVCYRLFVEGLIDSMATGNTAKVSRHLVWAREQGIIPWAWIVDDTRQAERVASWDNPGEILATAARQYRKDYWTNQPNWIEIWSEKNTIKGTLAPVLHQYGITFQVMRGFTSATNIQKAASETVLSSKPLTILYVGDWDPSGLHMSEVDIPRRLARYKGSATIRRIALTKADVTERGLPSFDAADKAKDPRHRWFRERYGSRCWELDALPPPILRESVEAEIRQRMDMDAWEHDRAIEQAEIQSMGEFLDEWQETISRQVSKKVGVSDD